MKIKELLEAVRDMKATTQSDAALLRYLNEIEGTAQTEVMNIDPADVVQYTEEDQETELLIGKPHHKLYIYYLMAMVDFGDGEYQRYQNGMQMANTCLSEWAKWWQRTYGSRCGGRHTVFLSAYGIAAKHGFTGSEEEWLDSLRGEPGKAFTYDDFTEEQLAALKDGVVQGALEDANSAARKADQAAQTADQAAQAAQAAAQEAAQTADQAAQAAQAAAQEAAQEAAQGAVEVVGTAMAEYADAAAEARRGAEKARAAIENMLVEAVTLATGEPAAVSKELVDGVVKLVFGLPAGRQGDRGDPGVSIEKIERTAGDGTPGTTDTYTITLTDGDTHEFQVYNGRDGAKGTPATINGKEAVTIEAGENVSIRQGDDGRLIISAGGGSPYRMTFTSADWTAGEVEHTLTIPASAHGMQDPAGAMMQLRGADGSCAATWQTVDTYMTVGADGSITLHAQSAYGGQVLLMG